MKSTQKKEMQTSVISLFVICFLCRCSETGSGDGFFWKSRPYQRGEDRILHMHEQEGEVDRQGNLEIIVLWLHETTATL